MTEKQRLNALRRKGERYVRLAYDLEADASALRGMGEDLAADTARGLMKDARSLGDFLLGRAGR